MLVTAAVRASVVRLLGDNHVIVVVCLSAWRDVSFLGGGEGRLLSKWQLQVRQLVVVTVSVNASVAGFWQGIL
jgi:hypothetical protein